MATRSFRTVLGTPCTAYRATRSGNSVASMMSALTLGLSIASWAANLAARGQWGQVGVTKTCACTAPGRVASAARVSGASAELPPPTSTMISSSVANSYPAGTP